MPYHRAHWWLLALFPLIALAYWPTYLGQLGAAPFAFHAHGLTATAWLVLLTAQSWSIHARRAAWHRAAGLATFAVLPLFAAGGVLALQGVMAAGLARGDPFHAAYGTRLAASDLFAGPAVVAMAAHELIERRRVRRHAAAMLATALLVLPPVLGRLTRYVPSFPDAAFGLSGFELSFHAAEGLTVLVALWLAWRDAAGRTAFGCAALTTAAQMVGFATFGDAAWWRGLGRRLVAMPPAAIAVAAAAGAFVLLWWAWRRVPPRPGRPAGHAALAA